MKLAACLLALCLSACATVDSSRMSDTCRGLYNACLDTCPKAPAAQPGQLNQLYIETAKCVERCNEQSKTCEPR